MRNGTLGNVTWETEHFYHLGNGTFYALGEGTLYSLGNGKFYPLGTILSSGNRDTYPLGIGPLILWETGISILWESGKGESVFNRYMISHMLIAHGYTLLDRL